MLHGLQHFVERKKREKLLSQKHFRQDFTMRFSTKGQEDRFGKWPSKLGSFTFKDYAPRVFQEIRRLSGIDTKDYIQSVCYDNYIEFISNSKSGAFFFFTNDGRYMIKTIEGSEAKCLVKFLEKYYLHLKSNSGSLLSRFYGLHRVKFNRPIAGRKKFHFIVMQSVFYTPNYIHAIFDLKGSEVGRAATEKDLKRKATDKFTGTVLKDNDLVNSKFKITLGPVKGKAFVDQISKDAKFLADNAIVDYSLLVGIHYPDLPDPRNTVEPDSPAQNFSFGTTKDSKGTPSPKPLTRHRRINTWSRSTSNLFPNGGLTIREDVPVKVKKPASLSPQSAEKKVFVDKGIPGRGRAKSAQEGPNGQNLSRSATSSTKEMSMHQSRKRAMSQQGSGILMRNHGSRSNSAILHRIPVIEQGIHSISDRQEIYYVGVIDILVQFGLLKQGEYLYKGYVQGHGKKVSVIPPSDYAKRFINFVAKAVGYE
ncbi:hypothetical protein AAMO2058_001241200 [Amorphochlora amoebiformis]